MKNVTAIMDTVANNVQVQTQFQEEAYFNIQMIPHCRIHLRNGGRPNKFAITHLYLHDSTLKTILQRKIY